MCEPCEAEGSADSVPAGLLHIAQQLGTVVEPQAGIQSEDARAGVLRFRRKAVAALVGRMKGRMPLGNEIGLARDPYAVQLPLAEHQRDRVLLLVCVPL